MGGQPRAEAPALQSVEERRFVMDTHTIQIIAGVLAVVVLFVIIWRRKQKTAK